MTNAPAVPAPAAPPALPPALPRVRTANNPSGGFAGIAAVGAAFAGILSYGGNPDLLVTAFAVGSTFLGAFVALHVLHFLFRLAMQLGKVAVPVVAILLLGCALDWPVAERAMDWLREAGHQGVDLAARGWTALQAG